LTLANNGTGNTTIYAQVTQNNSVAGTVIIWGAMLEIGRFPTSYIMTTSAQVARAADIAKIEDLGGMGFNAVEGTVYLDVQHYDGLASGYPTALSLNDGTVNNRIEIAFYTGPNKPGFSVRNAGVLQADMFAILSTNSARIAISYKNNRFRLAVNGATVATDTSGNLPAVNTLTIGSLYGTNQMSGFIKRLMYFPVELTELQMQGMTS
jgi:hypothetical protein